MAGELSNGTITKTEQTFTAPGSVRVRIHVRNASVEYALGYGGRGGRVDFTTPSSAWRFLPPGSYPLDESERPFDGIKVRAVTTTPAQVSIDCVSVT